MNKKKKIIVLVILLLVLIISGFFIIKDVLLKNDNTKNTLSLQSNKSIDETYLLKDYPITEVPLYDGVTISSMKYIVNEDSSNSYDKFFGLNRNYYNVVFETGAEKADVFNFYESKMSSLNQENMQTEDTIEGIIGKYKISISNYGYEDFYLQVHLPVAEFSKNNKYYENYPELVEINEDWVEYENSYGLLNQKGGEIEYSQWFELSYASYEDDSLVKVDRIKNFYDSYKKKYGDKTEFTSNDESGTLTWSENSFAVTAVFSSDHGRVYLMFRKPMK